ncbi:MAG: NUDIX hydrolase [Oligoflexus sp.]
MIPANPQIPFRPQQIIDQRFPAYQLPYVGRLGPLPPAWESFPEKRPSAVLCLLIPSLTEPHASIVLTKRSTKVRTHKGQIGFPGGRAESEDHDPVATAVRESWEEIGLDAEQLVIHGSLPWTRALDSHLVIPILASTIVDLSSLRANGEVDEIIPIPWSRFCHEEAQTFGFTMFGKRRESILYQHQHYRVWGLTAKMLSDADFQQAIK